MDKVRSRRWRLLTVLALGSILCIFHSQSYALDVTLQWDANTEPDLAGYVIYCKPGHSGDRIKENYTNHIEVTLAQDENPDPNVVEFTLRNLPGNQNYVFVVTAFDSESPRNESDTSNEASTDNVPPGRVSNLTSSHSVGRCSNDHTVRMDWTATTEPEHGSGLGGYSWLFDGFSATVPDENKDIGAGATSATANLADGTYYFHIRAVDKAGRAGVGNWGEAEHYGPFCIGGTPPHVAGIPRIDGSSMEVTYSENHMQNAAVAGNYTFDNGGIVSSVTDVTGEGRTFSLSLSNFGPYIIYTMTISERVIDADGNPIPSDQRTIRAINDTDSDGMADDWEMHWFGDTTSKNGTAHSDGDPNGMMDVRKYNVARGNPQWGANRWSLSPLMPDSDSDGISDKYETDYGMNPVDASDRNLDRENDGWPNYEEYLAGYAANNANSPVPAPPRVREVIPAGNGPVPSNSVFAVRLEATQGINIAESSGVTVTVNDGSRPYVRHLDNTTVKAIPLDSGGTASRNLWIAYYRSNETAMTNEFSSGVTVTVTFEATDIRKDSMNPRSLTFRIQTAAEEQEEADNLPNTVTLPNTPAPGLTSSGVTNTDTMLDGAAIIYDTSLEGELGVIPYVGPTDEVPAFNVPGYAGVGVAVNLLPPAVFPDGVTLMIPCPGYTNVSSLYVYYYNGRQWVMACDPAGNVQPGGVGWMVPGSRVNHNGNPAWVEIEVYHFSAVIAVTTSGTTVVVESGGGGGGCFISSIME